MHRLAQVGRLRPSAGGAGGGLACSRKRAVAPPSGSAPTLAKMSAQLVVPIAGPICAGRAAIGGLATGRQQQHLVANVEVASASASPR